MRAISTLVFGLLACGQALAWGKLGHRTVAELAQHQLSADARREVARLLSDEPSQDLAAIAVWADELRDGDPALGKTSASWHFVNFPRGDCHYRPERDCPNGQCVVGAIQAQWARLADRSNPKAERLEALKFLVHLVGDVHQPLHAGLLEDLGGNTFQIQVDGLGSNLHRVWDSQMLEAAGHADHLDYARILQPAPGPLPLLPDAAQAPAWAEESCRIIWEKAIYPDRPGNLPPGYYARYRPVAEQRLVLAGTRLAGLLNAAFDPAR